MRPRAAVAGAHLRRKRRHAMVEESKRAMAATPSKTRKHTEFARLVASLTDNRCSNACYRSQA